ncbi:histidine phosphatase family protein [Cupriavidus agavae]|nr:histidine phosphatase family protein [Cupriavidus agavae]
MATSARPGPVRLTLLCPPATAALRAGRFPDDDPLDAAGLALLAAAPAVHADRVLCSPARCAREAAAALGLAATVAPDLREIGHGRWTGQSLKAVAADEPALLSAWLSEPDFDGHGGESIAHAVARVARWLAGHPFGEEHALVIAPASIARAIVVAALEAPVRSVWQLELAPLTVARLAGGPGRWRLAALGLPLSGG